MLKIVQTVYISGVLQLIWHYILYIDVVEKGVTVWPTW